MSIGRLIVKEITRGLIGFTAAALVVTAAVAILIAQMTLFRAYDIKTDEILEVKLAETEAAMKAMEDQYRKITLMLGFNLIILPANQQLADFHAEGFAAKSMPENYVKRLSESGIMTVQHLLPSLQQKVRWPEQGHRQIVLIGVRGEVPLAHRDPKKPLLQRVPEGTAILGFEIWDSLGLKEGDPLTILEEEFTVGQCNAQRGTADDISIWIPLGRAQAMLDMQDEINSIMALKCFCENNDIDAIRAEISHTLPGVKVIELSARAKARDAARAQAAKTAKETIAAEKSHRLNMRSQQEAVAAWLIPSVILAAVATIVALAVANARRRLVELALLRALGFRTVGIMMLLVTRAVLIGTVGAVIGYAAGLWLGISVSELAATSETLSLLFVAWTVPALLIGTPILAAMACFPAAIWASSKDPAELLAAE